VFVKNPLSYALHQSIKRNHQFELKVSVLNTTSTAILIK